MDGNNDKKKSSYNKRDLSAVAEMNKKNRIIL